MNQQDIHLSSQFLEKQLSLPIDCMYPNAQGNEATDIREFMRNEQQAFQQAIELVRRNLNEK